MNKIAKSFFSLVAAAALALSAVPGATASAAEEIKVPTLYYGNEAAVNYTCSFGGNSLLPSKYERGVIVPIKVSAPGAVRFKLTFDRFERNATFNVYSDSGCTNSMHSSAYLSVGDMTKEKYLTVSSAGTYYVKIHSNVYGDVVFQNTIKMSIAEYTYSDKIIKSGQTIKYFRKNGSDKFYFKYKAAKTGKVLVSLPYVYGSYLTLTSSKKKALSEQEWVSGAVNSNKFSFAVKKGTTYYFLVMSNGASDGKIQSITVNDAKISEKSGSKKSKAVRVKAKKNVKGLIVAGENRADWYKFTLNKNKKLSINLAGEVSGRLKVKVYYKKKAIYTYNFSGGKAKVGTLFGKNKKGAYYIKIARQNSKSSGIYSFKWK